MYPLAIVLIVVAVLVPYGATYLHGWRRRLAVLLAIPMQIFAAVSVAGLFWNIWTALLVAAGLFATVNAARLIEGRMHEAYLQRAVRASSLRFVLLVAVLIAGWRLHANEILVLSWQTTALLATGLAAANGVFGLVTLLERFVTHRPRPIKEFLSDKELPSVSVAIPARNETDSLELTLKSVLASDYPKLEVLVLDDCSQDQTAEVIRSFAHEGVRFVQGTLPPDEHWLHKNFAYETLLRHASGEYILFCGADVSFESGTIRQMVTGVKLENIEMASWLPRRTSVRPLDALIQPMRYWWQMVIPKELFRRVPVLSTAWLIRRKTLKQLGGFASVSRMITPEAFFARTLHISRKYHFYFATPGVGLTSRKDLIAQYHTAVRTHYPDVKRRPERVFLLSLYEAVCLFAPFVLFLYGLSQRAATLTLLSAIACLVLIVTNVILSSLIHPLSALLALINLPFLVLAELGVLVVSMLRYEFGDVQWKGRNVCEPVMHVIPHLPKLD